MTVGLLRSGTGQETGGEGWEAEGTVVGREVGDESKQMMTKKSGIGGIQGEKECQPGEFNFGTNLGRGGGDLGSRGGGCGEKSQRARKALATVTRHH